MAPMRRTEMVHEMSVISNQLTLLIRHIIALMIGTEMVPEMSVVFNYLMWLIAQEDFINIANFFTHDP
jgi:hypothetical protein